MVSTASVASGWVWWASIATEFFGELDELPKEQRDKKIRQMNHLLVTGAVPGRKVGKFWLGSRRVVRQFIAGEVG